MSVINMMDGFNQFTRPNSLQGNPFGFSSIHIGIVTAISASTKTVYVKIPAVNEGAELGPYKCLQPFLNDVKTPVKQTLNVTTATVSSTTVVTSVALSNTTTDIDGEYENLNLPLVNDNVLVLLINDSLDQGVVLGRL